MLVDLIFCPKGMPIDDDVIARGEVMSVLGMEMRVMALEDVLVTKLMALTEHALRYEGLLPIARALREQVDWDARPRATADSPFARAFFVHARGPRRSCPRRQADAPAATSRACSVVTPRGSAAAHVG